MYSLNITALYDRWVELFCCRLVCDRFVG
jgi:hypothetical protein